MINEDLDGFDDGSEQSYYTATNDEGHTIPEKDFLLRGHKNNDPYPTLNNEGLAHPSSGTTDPWYARLFFIHLFIILYFSLFWGIPQIGSFNMTHHDSDNSNSTSPNHHHPTSQGRLLFFTFIATSTLGAIGAITWCWVLKHFTSVIIQATLNLSLALFGTATITGASGYLSTIPGLNAIWTLLSLIMTVSLYSYYSRIKSRIPFAVTNISTAIDILQTFPRLTWFAYGTILAQVVWILVWALALIGVWATVAGNYHGSSGGANVIVAAMVVSLFWGLQVLQNIVHVTAAGTVGEWWFNLSSAHQFAVERSIKRATGPSFGSICLGSLVVAILNTIRLILSSLRRTKGKTRAAKHVNACLAFLIAQLREALLYFNKYAYVQVALYGKDFKTSGYDTMMLFKTRGWSVIVNDSLINGVLGVGCACVGAVTGLVGAIWADTSFHCTNSVECEDTLGIVWMAFVICATIGFGMCSVVSSLVESMVATVFVCFAQDPTALQGTNPEAFNRIVNSWQTFHPKTMAASGPAYAVLCL